MADQGVPRLLEYQVSQKKTSMRTLFLLLLAYFAQASIKLSQTDIYKVLGDDQDPILKSDLVENNTDEVAASFSLSDALNWNPYYSQRLPTGDVSENYPTMESTEYDALNTPYPKVSSSYDLFFNDEHYDEPSAPSDSANPVNDHYPAARTDSHDYNPVETQSENYRSSYDILFNDDYYDEPSLPSDSLNTSSLEYEPISVVPSEDTFIPTSSSKTTMASEAPAEHHLNRPGEQDRQQQALPSYTIQTFEIPNLSQPTTVTNKKRKRAESNMSQSNITSTVSTHTIPSTQHTGTPTNNKKRKKDATAKTARTFSDYTTLSNPHFKYPWQQLVTSIEIKINKDGEAESPTYLRRNSKAYQTATGRRNIVNFTMNLYKALTGQEIEGRNDMLKIARQLAAHIRDMARQLITKMNRDPTYTLKSVYAQLKLSKTKVFRLSMMQAFFMPTVEELFRIFVPRRATVKDDYFMLKELCFWYVSVYMALYDGEYREHPFILDYPDEQYTIKLLQ